VLSGQGTSRSLHEFQVLELVFSAVMDPIDPRPDLLRTIPDQTTQFLGPDGVPGPHHSRQHVSVRYPQPRQIDPGYIYGNRRQRSHESGREIVGKVIGQVTEPMANENTDFLTSEDLNKTESHGSVADVAVRVVEHAVEGPSQDAEEITIQIIVEHEVPFKI
jgi:hypothetical protein